MTTDGPDCLRREIWDLLETREEANVRKAVELSSSLPKPGSVPDELTAQCIFDVAFGIEFFGEDDLAVGLYRRVLPYPVANSKYVASAWFRIGVCSNRQGNLAEAIHCYREALRAAQDLPHMITLAYFYLAELLEAAEDYGEAADYYAKVLPLLPHPDLEESRAWLAFARCSWRARRDERAVARLVQLSGNSDDPMSVEAYRLLAEIAEERRDYSQANRWYEQIIANPHSDTTLRGAAAYRLASIRNRSGPGR